MTNQLLTVRLKLSYVQVIRGGGEGLVTEGRLGKYEWVVELEWKEIIS